MHCKHSKIYKAKLISVHSAQKEQKPPEKQEKDTAIHAYFGMLQHIFQRNKHMIKELKLSGTKIQHKNRQNIKALIQGRAPSGLVRSNTKQQNQSQPNFQSLTRQKSLPNCGLMMTSLRYKSSQPRHRRKMTQKEIQIETKEQIGQFIPIGQASQKKIDLNKHFEHLSENKRQGLKSQGFIMLNFKNDHLLNQIAQIYRKNSFRKNRRTLKTKSQPNEQVTSYSSIRTSQNSHNEVSSVIRLPHPQQEVTPW